MSKYVRIKPYDPQKGYLRRRYMRDGKLYDVEKGWYLVDDEAAEILRTVSQHEYDKSEHPVPAFDICDNKAAVDAINKKEQKAQYEKLMKERGIPIVVGGEVPVNDLTTADLLAPEPAPATAADKKSKKAA
jgi:hypothetical protein